jgi:hypothetical protein
MTTIRRPICASIRHATFYAFLLYFASTSVATLYHYLLGRQVPYACHAETRGFNLHQ